MKKNQMFFVFLTIIFCFIINATAFANDPACPGECPPVNSNIIDGSVFFDSDQMQAIIPDLCIPDAPMISGIGIQNALTNGTGDPETIVGSKFNISEFLPHLNATPEVTFSGSAFLSIAADLKSSSFAPSIGGTFHNYRDFMSSHVQDPNSMSSILDGTACMNAELFGDTADFSGINHQIESYLSGDTSERWQSGRFETEINHNYTPPTTN